jgi:membrane protease YdiL (CAAX protease family)
LDRAAILLSILAVFAPLIIMGGVGEWLGDNTTLGAVLIMVAYGLSLAIATVVLKSRGTSWREIGLARPDSWPKTVLLGIGTLVAYLVVSVTFQAILQVVMQLLPGLEMAPADRSSFDVLQDNLPLLLLYLVAAWTTIALGEEMLFRAFLTNGLASLFPGARGRWAFALIGSSVVFGLAHFSWGFTGIVETTIMGLFFGIVYLRSGRNLWITIIAHSLANTLGFILVFAGVGY